MKIWGLGFRSIGFRVLKFKGFRLSGSEFTVEKI